MSPRHIDVRQEQCPAAREVLGRVGDKWSVLVIALLSDGSKRFSELRRSIEGVSQRMLTLTLRGLERDGLVKRTVYPTVPPRVDYALSPDGESMRPIIEALKVWGQARLERASKTSGRPVAVAAE